MCKFAFSMRLAMMLRSRQLVTASLNCWSKERLTRTTCRHSYAHGLVAQVCISLQHEAVSKSCQFQVRSSNQAVHSKSSLEQDLCTYRLLQKRRQQWTSNTRFHGSVVQQQPASNSGARCFHSVVQIHISSQPNPIKQSACLRYSSNHINDTKQVLPQTRSMHSAACLPVERLQHVITRDVCTALSSKGYAVVDGVFGPIMSQQLQLELMHVWQSGLMHINHTHLVNKGQTTLLAKSQVMEAELTLDAHIRQAAPLVAQLDADRRLQTMLNLFIPQLRLESHAIKMQHNEGAGGCFPMHFDSDEMLDGRRVTAIFYLNKDWKPSHGGQLRLYPFPAPPVDIEPVGDRLVLFASTRMLHRVLPSRVPRSCFTIWLSEGRSKASGVTRSPLLAPPTNGQPGDQLWHFLMQPAVRQHVCKLAYSEEWEASIRESHPDGANTDAALEKHRQEVKAIDNALAKFQPGLDQLLSAARSLAQEDGDSCSHAGTDDTRLRASVELLRRVAAHVNWF